LNVVILAAGRGSRLGSLTESTPKVLMRLFGKTLLDWHLDRLSSYFKLDDVHIIAGYCGHELKARYDNVIINDSWETTNIVGSLMMANELLIKMDAMVIYGDVWFETELIEALLRSSPPSVVSVSRWRAIWESRFDTPLEDLESFVYDNESKVLLEIGKKPESLGKIQGQFAGAFTTTPALWASARDLKGLQLMDSTSMLQALLSGGIEIKVCEYTGSWIEVDSPRDIPGQKSTDLSL